MYNIYSKTICVPIKVYALLKNTANARNCSMSKLVTKAVLAMLKKETNPAITQTANDKLIIEIKFDKN